MPKKGYDWKRFWCPPDGSISLSDGGYLCDPDAEWSLQDPRVVPFDAIPKVPCLVLIGEPGMGKSWEMGERHTRAAREAEATGDCALLFELRAYDTGESLHRAVFAHPKVRAWQEGAYHLGLFLDSLDEGLLAIATLAALLPEELRELGPHLHRLSLRIACRTAEWPPFLQQQLEGLWDDGAVKVCELAPLRRKDVVAAARHEGIAPDAFLAEVDRCDAVPLAIKPITLRFLLSTYQRNGRLPPTRAELYQEGCRILCDEPNPSRVAPRKAGALTPEERLVVAARLAALTVYGNRAAIWTGSDTGGTPGSDLRIGEVCGGIERINGQAVAVGRQAVEETLNTGLFSSRGTGRMGWAHQSYAEFLAAWYVTQHGMPLQQLTSLAVHPAAPAGQIVPQLQEAVGWLADLSAEALTYVTEADPHVLLGSDLSTASPATKAAIAQGLLERFGREELRDWDWGIRRRYERLLHPGLADQLRPYVGDKRAGWLVRRVAIDIAEACNLRELQDELLCVALDADDEHPTRVQAACAVTRIADDDTKARLRPLLADSDDADDELKGYALLALWPGHLTVAELLEAIAAPKQSSLIGAYQFFLRYKVSDALTPQDLPAALAWACAHAGGGFADSLAELANDIMVRAWNHLDAPGVLDGLAKAVFPYLLERQCSMSRSDKRSLEQAWQDDEERRRQLIEAVLPHIAEGPKSRFPLLHHPPLVTSNDVPWLLTVIQRSDSVGVQRVIAGLIDWLLTYDPEQVDLVHRTARENTVLWEQVSHHFEAVPLGPEYFRDLEERRRRREAVAKQHEELRRQRPDPGALIPEFLEQCEAGDTDGWWRLNWAVAIGPSDGHVNGLESDLTALPGWQRIVDLGEAKAIQAARTYLLEHEPQMSEWLGTTTVLNSDLAGYRAIRLLASRDPSSLRALAPGVWRKWAPITLAYPTLSGGPEGTVHEAIAALAYRFAPDELISTLTALIDKDNASHDHVFIIRKVEQCWDDRLAGAVVAKAREPHLKPSCVGDLLEEAVKHGSLEATAYAESLLMLPLPADDVLRARAVEAARVLLLCGSDAGWSAVWPALQHDSAFGRMVVSAVADSLDLRDSRPQQRLVDSQLADLYIWASRQYPHTQDPNVPQAHAVGTREHIAHWRDSLLADLKARGTLSAVEQVSRVVRELPEAEFLKWHLLEAREITYRRSWNPPSPRYILDLVASQDARLVENGDQLMALVLESLERLQKRLHGEIPAAADLWNEKPRSHKAEAYLSDYVARHLTDDLGARGVIANREAQIHLGERTDIHVDAVSRRAHDAYRTLTVIIEAKGCWNPELYSAMKSQLAGQYLRGNACQHGVYLAGWFGCSPDVKARCRKPVTQCPALAALHARLEQQAEELSVGATRICAFVLDASLR